MRVRGQGDLCVCVGGCGLCVGVWGSGEVHSFLPSPSLTLTLHNDRGGPPWCGCVRGLVYGVDLVCGVLFPSSLQSHMTSHVASLAPLDIGIQ